MEPHRPTLVAKDLARTPPAGLDAEIDGYAWLPRMLAKARATLTETSACFRLAGIHRRAPASPRTQAPALTTPTLAFVISGPCTGRSELTDRARRKPARRRSGEGFVSGARFSRHENALGGSVRARP